LSAQKLEISTGKYLRLRAISGLKGGTTLVI
jgi:hypothetical protein